MGKELFDPVPSKVGPLLDKVQTGEIGLPDLQRPFVWGNEKVRDLLDSMMKGFPVGYIMLWSSPSEYKKTGQIGEAKHDWNQPDSLVIDGQQRITGLLSAMCNVTIKDKDYKNKVINIGFNPLTCKFMVTNVTVENNPEWISRIYDVYYADEENHDVPSFRLKYIKGVNEKREKDGKEPLTDEEKILIENNINALIRLKDYSIPTLKISEKADEEDVSEIFVRVNSGGQKLTENNFIETLLAVYDSDTHKAINDFCEESRIPQNGTAFNQILVVNPADLTKIAIGYGFNRARMKYAYMLLRGKDLKTGNTTEETRNENLEIFRNALDVATNINTWHAFMNLVMDTGYISKSLVSSDNAIIYAYVLYLLGKKKFNVTSDDLRRIIRKWIFMSSVTGYFTSSPETTAERLFVELKGKTTKEEFLEYLETIISSRMTEDYFNVTLPEKLITSGANSPVWLGYIASINILGTPMLFSNTLLAKYFDTGTSGNKNAIDKHHIFPKHYLEETLGITDDKIRNQIANFTYLDYQTNIDIKDRAPYEYIPEYKAKLGEDKFRKTCDDNALPDGFENMSYDEFLNKRRVLMAGTIKNAFANLCQNE